MRAGACTRARSGPDARDDAGAAAVEAGLLISAILMPLLLGVINYGHYFWQLQRVPELDPNIDQSGLVGTYCLGQIPDLLTRVREAALVAANNLDDGNDLPLSLSDITATVVSYTPDTLGLVVEVGFSTNVIDELISFLPLPDDGNLVSGAQVRLQNVKITSGSC
jgi:hypothetical protein